MSDYDIDKLKIVKEWVRVVASKKQVIRNPLGYAKKVYESTEQMDSWSDLKSELENEKHKMERKKEILLKTNIVESELETSLKQKLNTVLASIPQSKFERLRSKYVYELSANKELMSLIKDTGFNKGIGKSLLQKKIYEGFLNGE
jgi:glycerol-3-phosphate dehydrogenase